MFLSHIDSPHFFIVYPFICIIIIQTRKGKLKLYELARKDGLKVYELARKGELICEEVQMACV